VACFGRAISSENKVSLEAKFKRRWAVNAATILSLAALVGFVWWIITVMRYLTSPQRKVDERLRRYAKR